MEFLDQIKPKDGISNLKKKKKNENHHQILNVQISLGSKYQLQQTILIYWNKFPKQECFEMKTKNEHYHWIFDIRISLGINFEQTILNFGTKFVQNRHLWWKTGKVFNSVFNQYSSFNSVYSN